MIDHGIVVRVGCEDCGTFFDVDLIMIARIRGREFSLINQTTRCKVTNCRGRNYFVAAPDMSIPLITLLDGLRDPLDLNGRTPWSLEPTEPPDPSGRAMQISAA